MTDHPHEHVRTLLSDFESAMLVTRVPSGELRSRPMIIADLEGEAELWFVTGIGSGKVGEIAEEHQVNVALQSKRGMVSISGTAEIVRDPAQVRRLWKESFRAWFPKGQEDPEIALIRVVPDTVEYWDLEQARNVRRVWQAARAYLRGEHPKVGVAHATVRPT